MQLAIFTIPINNPGEETARLNKFLSGNRIISVKRGLAQLDAGSAWSILVEYIPKGEKESSKKQFKNSVDYREILSEEDFALFSKLREWRKRTSEEEAVPVYAILTNEQLSQIVTERAATKSKLQAIPGIGKGTHRALYRALHYCKRRPWFIKMDIRKFFEFNNYK